jgi:hypothetical protein
VFHFTQVPRCCCATKSENPARQLQSNAERHDSRKASIRPNQPLIVPPIGAGGRTSPPALISSDPLPYLGSKVIRSVSLPSEETDLYFSVALTAPEQPDESHERLPSAVLMGVPVMSVTLTFTSVPAQTGIRWAVSPSESGSTMFPMITCETFGLLDGLWPLPTVTIWVTPQVSLQVGSAVGVGADVGVDVGVGSTVGVDVGVGSGVGSFVGVDVGVAVGVGSFVGVDVGVGSGVTPARACVASPRDMPKVIRMQKNFVNRTITIISPVAIQRVGAISSERRQLDRAIANELQLGATSGKIPR